MAITHFACSVSTPLSGWYATARGGADAGPVLLAIHGGGYTSHYWKYASMGSGTLAQIGPAAGMPVVAVNRPGTGLDATQVVPYDEQANLIVETVASLLHGPLADGLRGRRVFVVGHSIGGMLATLIGANGNAPFDLLGLDLSGFSTQFRPGPVVEGLYELAALPTPAESDPEERLALFFGAPGTWDPAVGTEDVANSVPIQPLDAREALAWPDRFPSLAAKIDVPVRYSVAGLDPFWKSDEATLTAVRECFVNSPQVVATIDEGVGHCHHLHRSGSEYLRRAVQFADLLSKR